MLGFEPLTVVASDALAGLITDVLKENSSSLIGQIKSNLNRKTRQAIFKASGNYAKNYIERHGLIKVLGMREPVNLDSVYITVRFLDNEEVCSFASIEDLEKAFHPQERTFQPKAARQESGIDVANKQQYLMVLGAPGSGKSTFLHKIGLEALKNKKGQFEHNSIPVFIELKKFTEGDFNIKQAIVEEFQICGLPAPETFVEQSLAKGRLLVLLDGLDEVPSSNLAQVIGAIHNFVDRYSKNRYIISCRLAAYRYHSYFRRFTDVTVADFSNEQIQQFIYYWFQSEKDKEAGTAQKCWRLLQKPENAAAKELARTPLLLTFLCLVYDYSQNFPDSRSTLYRKALRILLEEWAAEKRIFPETIYQGLSTELEEVLLSEIAYRNFVAGRLFFYQSEIVSQIKTFLETNLNAPKHLSGEAVLDAIAVQQGILVERAEGVYSFSHLTLQEYLTAQYIHDRKEVGELVMQHLTEERWHEVFLLVSGLMRAGKGADDLLQAMHQATRKCAKIPKLKAILQWTQQRAQELTSRSADVAIPIGKRATALLFALDCARITANRVLTPTLDHTISLAQRLASDSNRNFVKDRDHDRELARYLTRSLDVAAIRARDPKSACDLNLAGYLDKLLTRAVELAYESADEFKRARALDITDAGFSTGHGTGTFKRTHAHAHHRSEILAGTDFPKLASELKALRDNIPDIHQARTAYQKFAKKLWQVCLRAFQLNSTLLKISQPEAEVMRKYLYANYLLVQCKQSAVRVSPQTWEKIEWQMLLPVCGAEV